MKDELQKIMKKFGEIFLTALFAGILAYIQNILTQNGIHCGIPLDTEKTAQIGGFVGSVKIAVESLKNYNRV